MASTVVDENLAGWLESVTISISPEQFRQWRTTVTAIAKATDADRAFGLVRASHGQLDEQTGTWMSERIREQDPTFSGIDKTALLTVLAGAAVIEIVDNARHTRRALVALLALSGGALGWTTAVPEVNARSKLALAEISVDSRRRKREIRSPAKAVEDLLDDTPELPETPDWTGVGATLDAYEKALKLLATRAGDAIKQLTEVIELQDEELNTLWWSFGGRSTALGKKWEAIAPPTRRAVLAVSELHGLLKHVPGPSSLSSLIARCLGRSAATEVSLGDMAQQAVDGIGLDQLPSDALLPIATAVSELRSVGAEDDTWKTVVQRRFRYDADHTLSLLSASEQLMREFDVQALIAQRSGSQLDSS